MNKWNGIPVEHTVKTEGEQMSSLDLNLRNKIEAMGLVVWSFTGSPPCITSMMDSRHSENSLHYKGKAFDLRTKDWPKWAVFPVAYAIARTLNAGYAMGPSLSLCWVVVIESNHLHIQLGWDNIVGGVKGRTDSVVFKKPYGIAWNNCAKSSSARMHNAFAGLPQVES